MPFVPVWAHRWENILCLCYGVYKLQRICSLLLLLLLLLSSSSSSQSLSLSSRRCISIHTYVTTFLIYCFLTCNCAAFVQSELNWTALTIFHGYWQFCFNKRTWCDLLLMSLSMCFRLWFVIILFLLCFLFCLCNWPYGCYANKLIIRKLNLTELKSHQFTWVRERVFFYIIVCRSNYAIHRWRTG